MGLTLAPSSVLAIFRRVSDVPIVIANEPRAAVAKSATVPSIGSLCRPELTTLSLSSTKATRIDPTLEQRLAHAATSRPKPPAPISQRDGRSCACSNGLLNGKTMAVRKCATCPEHRAPGSPGSYPHDRSRRDRRLRQQAFEGECAGPSRETSFPRTRHPDRCAPARIEDCARESAPNR